MRCPFWHLVDFKRREIFALRFYPVSHYNRYKELFTLFLAALTAFFVFAYFVFYSIFTFVFCTFRSQRVQPGHTVSSNTIFLNLILSFLATLRFKKQTTKPWLHGKNRFHAYSHSIARLMESITLIHL